MERTVGNWHIVYDAQDYPPYMLTSSHLGRQFMVSADDVVAELEGEMKDLEALLAWVKELPKEME